MLSLNTTLVLHAENRGTRIWNPRPITQQNVIWNTPRVPHPILTIWGRRRRPKQKLIDWIGIIIDAMPDVFKPEFLPIQWTRRVTMRLNKIFELFCYFCTRNSKIYLVELNQLNTGGYITNTHWNLTQRLKIWVFSPQDDHVMMSTL
jgi:hypothetical protein